MLENVFATTRLVPGEKVLSLKYQPRNSAECCISESDKRNVRHHLENERFFAVHSNSGCGSTICVKCIAKETNLFFVHELSCSIGCVHIIKFIKQNMKNVLLALQQQNKRILILIKDFEIMKRNEKSQIISAIENSNTHAVLFLNNTLCHTAWKLISFSPLSFDDKMIHLCWICAEEALNLKLEQIENLAAFTDFRHAINSLKLSESIQVHEREHSTIDNTSKVLFANESIDCKNVHVLSTFADLMSLSDISEYKSTKFWYIDLIADYIDQHDFKFKHKQSSVARHAQMTHRIHCLKSACSALSIDPVDINLYSRLYKNLLYQNINPLKKETPNYQHEAKSFYTIAKIGASSSHCKIFKKLLS